MDFAAVFEDRALTSIYAEMAALGATYRGPDDIAADDIECIIEPSTDEMRFADSTIMADDVIVAVRDTNEQTIARKGVFAYKGSEYEVKRRRESDSPLETHWLCRPIRDDD